jgi:hypothetical protein
MHFPEDSPLLQVRRNPRPYIRPRLETNSSQPRLGFYQLQAAGPIQNIRASVRHHQLTTTEASVSTTLWCVVESGSTLFHGVRGNNNPFQRRTDRYILRLMGAVSLELKRRLSRRLEAGSGNEGSHLERGRNRGYQPRTVKTGHRAWHSTW